MSLLSSPTQRSKHLQRGLSLLRRATTSIEGLKTHAPPPPLPVMESISPSSRKRPFDDFPSSNPPPTERRVRFPKGKKSKKGGERLPVGGIDNEGEVLPVWGDANVAATERAKRRNRMIEEEVLGRVQPHHAGSFNEIVARSEVPYEENPSFDDSGVPLDPFNLDHEREEGYFDESGNYVEYMRNNEIKDAWLDSIDAEVKFVEPKTVTTAEREEEDYDDLSTAEIGRIKRSIANVLKPGETVMQALRRLKGTSGDKKQKMSEDTKCLFDDLTENAMKLMDNGEYNVYHEERETFEREAEGYEHLARARGGSLNGNHEPENKQADFSESRGSYASVLETVFRQSEANSTKVSSSDAGGEFDMFGDDDENEEKSSADPNSNLNIEERKSGLENDYVFDDSTGYYYSSSLGYYYDPGSRLYCSAMTGKWYAYNEQTSSYDEIESQDASVASATAPVTD